jgi:aryl-alcohol dehydrogenase-like predicted oxidoreductase
MFRRDKVEKDFLPLYETIGLGTTIWSPLASGILTGKYNDGIPDSSRVNLKDYEWLKNIILSPAGQEKIEKTKVLADLAKEIGVTLPELGLIWCLKNPNVSTVITGASKPEQVKQNMKAIDKVDLVTDDVMESIEEIIQTKPEGEWDFR